jgi:hypothetical protein
VTITHAGIPEKSVTDHTQGWTELLEWLENATRTHVSR